MEPNTHRELARTLCGAPLRIEAGSAEVDVRLVEGKRHRVEVRVTSGAQAVLEGTFVCFVPAHHLLATRRDA